MVALIGISGVGKTTLLTKTRTGLSFEHLQASELIREEREYQGKSAASDSAMQNASLDENQLLLIEGFRRMVPANGLVVLDAHSVVDTPDGLFEISSSVFERLEISLFILLTEKPSEIVRRRSSDTNRRRSTRSISEIGRQQMRSVQTTFRIARILDVPVEILGSDKGKDLMDLLRALAVSE